MRIYVFVFTIIYVLIHLVYVLQPGWKHYLQPYGFMKPKTNGPFHLLLALMLLWEIIYITAFYVVMSLFPIEIALLVPVNILTWILLGKNYEIRTRWLFALSHFGILLGLMLFTFSVSIVAAIILIKLSIVIHVTIIVVRLQKDRSGLKRRLL